MDFIVFLASYVYGFVPGALVALLSWFIYGTLKPYGFNISIFLTYALRDGVFGCRVYSW